MLISVVIPVYNGEKYLRECLSSVQACPSDGIECIIINDGSADGTERLCRDFAGADRRFRLVSKENAGVSEARNAGVAEASGEYIFFLDADDYIAADAWQGILAHAAGGGHDMVAYGYYNLFDGGGTSVERFPEGCDIKRALLATTLLNPCWGKLLRREVILKNDIRFMKGLKTCEDSIFMLDFAQCAETFLLSDTPVLYYRIHAESVMRSAKFESKLADFAALSERRGVYLAANHDSAAERAMNREQFSVVTDLFRSHAKSRRISEIKRAYKAGMADPAVAAVIAGVDRAHLSPFYKRLEYAMMTRGRYACLAVYFKLKGRLS